MKVLLVGSGGREHALAKALSASKDCSALYCAPGNAGIADVAHCVALCADDIEGLTRFAQDHAIDFVMVGPEGPLVAGLVDSLRAKGIKVFGPDKAAARLEGSKGFMKDFCQKYHIPTAAYGRFSDYENARLFITQHNGPLVVKADGLAAGKGVVICQNIKEALDAAHDMLSGHRFGGAGAEIVVEEFLDGEELSYFALSDGKTLLPFGSAQDHKRAFDGDQGPNTGGMGAYSPARLVTATLEEKIITRLIQPTIKGMKAEGCPFVGVLFAGIMVVKGEPVLLEYNTRFGDPECQTLILRLESDLLEILYAGATGNFETIKDQVTWSPDPALCVVMAASGYPGDYRKNTVIRGLEKAGTVEGATLFHAGTARNADNQIIATGGRVLGITACGTDLNQARERAYRAVDLIDWPEGFCRRDIGWRAL